jgi:hypothetical protein
LLNPSGSHGLKNVFLDAFIRIFEIKGLPESTEVACVDVEKYFGPKLEDCSKGGRIDIVISFGKKYNIFIENKIYAPDQECQLVRYHNNDRLALLLYLTLDGRAATDWSANNLATGQMLEPSKDYFPVSYERHVLLWLEECKKESVNFPLVRETITQYINLIKILTNQNESESMSAELAKVVLNNIDSFRAFDALRESVNDVMSLIIRKIKEDLCSVADNLRLEIELDLDSGKRNASFSFSNEKLKRIGLKIRFEFRVANYMDCIFGYFYDITQKTDKLVSGEVDLYKERIDKIIQPIFEERFHDLDNANGWWPALCSWGPPYGNWGNWDPETLGKIFFNGETFRDALQAPLKELVDIIDKLDEKPLSSANY